MSRRLTASVLLGHYLSAFTALGAPLFLPRILADLNAPAPTWSIGVLYVLPTLCTALAAPVWGRLADRHGCRLSLLRAHAGLAAGFLLAGFSPNLAVFTLALVVQGTFGGAMAASNAYLATQLAGEGLARALNLTQYSARLALLTGPVLVGLLASAGLGLEIYRYLAWLPLAAFVLVLPLPVDAPRTEAPAADGTRGGGELPADLLRLLAVQFLFSFAMVVTFPYFVPYGEDLGLANDALIGLLYSLPHLVYLLALPWVQRRGGPLLAMGLAVLALANLLQFLRLPAELLVALRLLSGLGMLLGFVGLHRCLAERRKRAGAGRLFGWFDASGKWAGSAAGLVAGLAVQLHGAAMPFLIASLAALAALAVATPLYARSPETAA